MSSTLIFVGLPEDSKSSITKTISEVDGALPIADLDDPSFDEKDEMNYYLGVPNAPKSSIGEIFSSDTTDMARSPKNGITRPRGVRDTPTRPRDTHSRLFGQTVSSPPAPMVTDTIRSHIQFGEGAGAAMTNGHATPTHSPRKSLTNGNGHASPAVSTPSRGETEAADHSLYTPLRRNPVTGDGVVLPPQRRRHPAAMLRGAEPHYPDNPRTDPQPTHAYYTQTWPPNPGDYYVDSTTKPPLCFQHTPHSLIEGNPITGVGYKSLNGEINTVTGLNGISAIINHNRVPPGGYSSGLW